MDTTTAHVPRPTPRRPDTGLQAWQATMGYMSQEHSPDAILSLRAYGPEAGKIAWTASVAWAAEVETMRDQDSLARALRGLWTALDSRHTIFKTPEAAWRSPVDYDDETYFDAATDEIVQRLVKVTAAAFGEGWRIAMLYQPAGLALTRVQANLFAREDKVHVYARGSSLRETCQNLYRNAASHFADHD